MRQAHRLQRLSRAPARLGVANLSHFQGKRDVVLDCHMRKQRVVLKHDANVAIIGGTMRDIGIVDQDLPFVRMSKACDQAQ
jgi:hypothetical protein